MCLLEGNSECKWGFYGKSDDEVHPEDKRGLIAEVNEADDVPSGACAYDV